MSVRAIGPCARRFSSLLDKIVYYISMNTSQPASLLFLLKNDQILLAMKKRGFGEGLWNGVGGKPEGSERMSQTAVRECQEEIGVTPQELIEVGSLHFTFSGSKEIKSQHVTVYFSRQWGGEPIETEEMAPRWFQLDMIPYDKMWEDDKYWLPLALRGNYVEATFLFNEHNNLEDHSIAFRPLPYN